jgi:hypothetical protein
MAGERGIPPDEWQHVTCLVCHPEGDRGDFQKVAWLDIPFTLTYQQLDANWVVCENCHVASGTVDHIPVTVSGVHSGMNCLDCHDPHTAAASCTQAGCHFDFEEACVPVIEHSKPHQAAACQACHASGEYLVNWDQGRELWNLVQTNEAGQLQRAGFISPHTISLEANCERCHTPGELPWMQ